MKVEYVAPFAESATFVFKTLLGIAPERGQLSARPQLMTTHQVNVVCGIEGPVEGLVIIGMTMVTADKLAGRMIGATVVTFDAVAANAIAELGSMIASNAAMLLSESGYGVDIRPPAIIRGANVKITTLDLPSLVIPLHLKDMGTLEISVSLQERPPLAMAA